MAAFLKLRRDGWWVTGREIRKVTMSFEAWSVKYRVRVPWNIHQRVASRDPLSSVRSIRAGKLLEFSILRTRGPFLRNPSVKISISTFHSLHSIPCRGGPDPHPLLCLDEVIKDAAAISGASRADEQAENQPTTGLDPGDARGIFFEPLNRSPSPTEKLYIRSVCSSSDFLHQSLRFLEKKRERKKNTVEPFANPRCFTCRKRIYCTIFLRTLKLASSCRNLLGRFIRLLQQFMSVLAGLNVPAKAFTSNFLFSTLLLLWLFKTQRTSRKTFVLLRKYKRRNKIASLKNINKKEA